MAENQNKPKDPNAYKERYEFVLTTNGNIICQRYFRINNFNPKCLGSYELVRALRESVEVIDRDLRDKSHIYLNVCAPRTFDSIEEMERYLANPNNRQSMVYGEGMVVRGNTKTDYAFDGTGWKELGFKFDDGELTMTDIEENSTKYKFAFKISGREVASIEWTGVYPRFVREKIDLSNKRGKFVGADLSQLSFDSYMLYLLAKDRGDLVYGIIKNICHACSLPDKNDYTVDTDGILEEWNRDSKLKMMRML